jgi:hypothetical protein
MSVAIACRYVLLTTVCLVGSGVSTAKAEEKAADTISVFGEKNLGVPKSWARTKPASSIVEHEFLVKEGEGDDAPTARVTMMAAGGDVKANIDRWKGQFAGGNAAAQKSEEKKIGKASSKCLMVSRTDPALCGEQEMASLGLLSSGWTVWTAGSC